MGGWVRQKALLVTTNETFGTEHKILLQTESHPLTMASSASTYNLSGGPKSLSPPPPRVTPMSNVNYDDGNKYSQSLATSAVETTVPTPQRGWTNMTRTIAHYELERCGSCTG